MKALVEPGLSIIAAIVVAWVMSILGVPLAWVIGPMLLSMAVSLSGRRTFASLKARKCGQMIIGAAIGLNLTFASIQSLWIWMPAAIVLNVSGLFIALFLGRLLSKALDTNQATSFFSLVPGGLSEMANIASTAGGHDEIVAIIQALRVALAVCIMPPLVVHLGLTGDFISTAPLGMLDLTAGIYVALAAVAGVTFARLLRLNNPWMIGALAGTATLAMLGMASGKIPRLIFCAGQLMIGMAIGARFKMEHLIHVGKRLWVAISFILLTMVIMAVISLLFSIVSGFDLASSLLAMSPGGFSEMAATADILHLNVALVTIFHVTRAFIVNGFAYRFWMTFGKS